MIHIPHCTLAHSVLSPFPLSLKLSNKEVKIVRNLGVPKYILEVRSSDRELRNLLIINKRLTNT